MPRVEINGQVVEFAQMPSPEDIDHVAGTLGTRTTTTTSPRMGFFGALRRATEGPAGLQQAAPVLREQAPLAGQVIGGLVGGPLGGLVGGIGGSAVKRGGVPTVPDVLTTGLGEALPMIPGAGRAATRFLSERAAPRLMEAASRFKVPLGLGEASQSPVVQSTFQGLFRNPFAARALGRAGKLQSDAILAASDRISERWFGGALPASQFGRQAAKAIGETVKRLPPERAAALQGQVTELAGQVVAGTKLAERLAKTKPEELVPIMRQVGEGGMQMARSAWWTSALERATVKKAGPRQGLVNASQIVKAWDALGEQGQSQLFGNRMQHLREFIKVLESAKTSELAGSKTHLPGYFRYTAFGVLLGRGGGWGRKLGELLGVEAATPWYAAHVLANGTAGEVSQVLAPVGPTLARIGAQSLGSPSTAGAALEPHDPGEPQDPDPGAPEPEIPTLRRPR